MEKFYLDLETILQSFHLSGDLHGDLPAKKLRNKAPWKAYLRVVEGQVLVCQIFDKRGAIVSSGEPAFVTLLKLGPLNWTVIPDPLAGTLKPPLINKSGPLLDPEDQSSPDTVPARSPVPFRLVNVTLKQMNQTQWPRNYRLVYILVDGVRTSEKISTMLIMPLADVQHILHELQVMRIIDIKP